MNQPTTISPESNQLPPPICHSCSYEKTLCKIRVLLLLCIIVTLVLIFS